MANHRPKSLSELNNVYDKAMRAERAIKESSNLLSVPEDAETPRTENIFDQLENQAIQAEKNKVFDPDITNIANDFLKRYAQPEKPKATPKEIKRPAPSIQSVYHTAVIPKKDVALNEDSASALGDIKASASEDFALIAERVPSCYLYLTAGFADARGDFSAHNPRVVFDESVLAYGAAAYALAAVVL